MAAEEIPGWGRALDERVNAMKQIQDGFAASQSVAWGRNSETHKDLYSKLDRLPAWATLLIALLTGVAGSGWSFYLAQR